MCSRCLERGHCVSTCPNNIQCRVLSGWSSLRCCLSVGATRQCGTARRHRGLQHQGTPDPQVSNIRDPPDLQVSNIRNNSDPQVSNTREPSSHHETSDNKASRDDEDQWEHLWGCPSRRLMNAIRTAKSESDRQQSVTRRQRLVAKSKHGTARKNNLRIEADRWQEFKQNRQSWTMSSASMMPGSSGQCQTPGIPLVA